MANWSRIIRNAFVDFSAMSLGVWAASKVFSNNWISFTVGIAAGWIGADKLNAAADKQVLKQAKVEELEKLTVGAEKRLDSDKSFTKDYLDSKNNSLENQTNRTV